MKQTIPYSGGQRLSFSDFGNREGYPILIQHGLIAGITDFYLFDRLVEAGARLISIARPGYGDSSPYVMRNMAEWGEIVAVLVDQLKLPQFDVLGISSGAPYSYAIAYKLPVRNLYIFGGIPALYDPQIAACWPYPVNREATIPDLQTLAYDLFFSNLSAEDLQQAYIQDSMRNDGFGLAQDFRLRVNDWGFTLADVEAPVYMQHSRDDQSVPFVTAELTARLLPHCRFEVRTGEHFSPELLGSFLQTVVADYFTA
jgi:pimeloyl-ACP methyl ester carboxylesterase